MVWFLCNKVEKVGDWSGQGNTILNHIKFDHKDVVILRESSTDIYVFEKHCT